MQFDRREQIRYKVNDNSFAVINPEPVRLVPILDISRDGIGVYANNEDQWLDKASKLEIMVADCSFYLENISCEPISVSKAFHANSSNLIDGHHCSLKFHNLTPSQKSELSYFIRNYTQGGVFWRVRQKFSKLLSSFRANNHSAPSCNTGVWQNVHRPTV